MHLYPRRLGWPMVVLLAACAVGCWEEIRYEPSAETEASKQPAESSAETHSPDADAIPVAEVPTSAVTPTETASAQTAPEAPLEPPQLDPPAESAATPDAVVVPTASPAERLLVWQAAGKWSLATAMAAKQLPSDRFEPIRNAADAAAVDLGITLPPPESSRTHEQAAIDALSGEPMHAFIASLSSKYGAEASSLGELAIRSNLLLLTYSPRRGDATAEASKLQTIAEASGLPSEEWMPLVELLQSGSEYVTVRTAVFELHRHVESTLAEASR